MQATAGKKTEEKQQQAQINSRRKTEEKK